MTRTLTIYRTYFTDTVDGEYLDPRTTEEAEEGLSAKETAERIISEGLSFEATGNDWAANPDGSYITDYRTGERCAVSAHLAGYPDRLVEAIIRRVG